jgi:hypothetical protein
MLVGGSGLSTSAASAGTAHRPRGDELLATRGDVRLGGWGGGFESRAGEPRRGNRAQLRERPQVAAPEVRTTASRFLVP